MIPQWLNVDAGGSQSVRIFTLSNKLLAVIIRTTFFRQVIQFLYNNNNIKH